MIDGREEVDSSQESHKQWQNNGAVFPLTSFQLIQLYKRVNDAYAEAEKAYKKAFRKDQLLKRYIRRYYETCTGNPETASRNPR